MPVNSMTLGKKHHGELVGDGHVKSSAAVLLNSPCAHYPVISRGCFFFGCFICVCILGKLVGRNGARN